MDDASTSTETNEVNKVLNQLSFSPSSNAPTSLVVAATITLKQTRPSLKQVLENHSVLQMSFYLHYD